MRLSSAAFLVLLLSVPLTASAQVVPGFGVEPVLEGLPGFGSSVVVDSQGTIYVTTTDGWIHRIGRDGVRTAVAMLPTRMGGNGGLLGMALVSDNVAAVHYTTWSARDTVLADVISLVDLTSGAETVLHSFVCDHDDPADGVSSEHHGGNPTVAPDGSIFVGFGEYGGRTISQKPEWNGGKLFRVETNGNATQWALGLRNPYDLAWDPALDAIVLSDNGTTGGDEINVVRPGDNLGWPNTEGHQAPMEGAKPPVYVFPSTVAPTGLARLTGATPILRTGYLSTAFVTNAIYYFPSITEPATGTPWVLLQGSGAGYLIDVTEAPSGGIVFIAAGMNGTGVYRLVTPRAGDCDGDGHLTPADLDALAAELADGGTQSTFTVHLGSHASSWGCDANNDGLVSAADADAVRSLMTLRRRAARS